MLCLSSSLEATEVVKLPPKGSRTKSPLFELALINILIKSFGIWQG